MADFSRVTTVGVGVDAAFDYFADISHLPEYLGTARLEDADAIDGEEAATAPDPPGVTFLADRATHVIRWSRGDAYGGSIELRQATPSMTDVSLRLRTRDDVDPAEVTQLIERSVRTIGRRLSGLPTR